MVASERPGRGTSPSRTIKERDPMLGTVKWFNQEKGYGFIEIDGTEIGRAHV